MLIYANLQHVFKWTVLQITHFPICYEILGKKVQLVCQCLQYIQVYKMYWVFMVFLVSQQWEIRLFMNIHNAYTMCFGFEYIRCPRALILLSIVNLAILFCHHYYSYANNWGLATKIFQTV